MHQLIKQKPYCGVMVGLQKVAKTSSIQVHGIGKLTSDYLALKFESIDDVDDADVERCAEDDYALVHFADNTGNVFADFCTSFYATSGYRCLRIRTDVKGSDIPSIRNLLVVEERLRSSGCL